MKRTRRHKVKCEPSERPATQGRGKPDRDCDLAHYVHDRVELLQRAFAALRPRELKAMAPSCVASLSPDDLQELCLEELLGISSVRLCAVLDGAEPPSDTESSSESSAERRLETISLDSISSDERALSPAPVQHHNKKRKRRCKRSEGAVAAADVRSRAAERAGLTVLELLELQARARAIRAQLAMEHTHATKEAPSSATARAVESDNDVQIKEEPPEVVELSSDDEARAPPAPDPATLSQNQLKSTESQVPREETEAVTKTRTDLTIIVPKTQPRKIKLKRTKVVGLVMSTQKQVADVCTEKITPAVSKEVITNNTDETSKCIVNSEARETDERKNKKAMARQAKQKRKKQEEESKRSLEKEGSDHDEIMIQLSDSEKMDLLEDFDRKNYDNVSSSESVASSSDSESAETDQCDVKHTENGQDNQLCNRTTVATQSLAGVIEINSDHVETLPEDGLDNKKIEVQRDCKIVSHDEPIVIKHSDQENVLQNSVLTSPSRNTEGSEQVVSESIPLNDEKDVDLSIEACEHEAIEVIEQDAESKTNDNVRQEVTGSELIEIIVDEEKPVEVEDMVTDSDRNREKTTTKKKRKSKKKNSDVLTISDQNINKDKDNKELTKSNVSPVAEKAVVTERAQSDSIDEAPYIDSDSVYEILEISDDSSCYEVEGVSILSKEPTSEEIEALSAKIDHEIEREEGATGTRLDPQLEHVSWKHRYLDSKKVKKIMSTSNILNALRKKNKELKKKLEESRLETVQVEVTEVEKPAETTAATTEEGTIDQYNTLESCTKYVEPAPPLRPGDSGAALHKAMEKDAKQLLKMYKRLLKYNHMEKDRNKTKSKKKRTKKKSTESSNLKTAEG